MNDFSVELNKGLENALEVHKSKDHQVVESFLEKLGVSDYRDDTVAYLLDTFNDIADEKEDDDLVDYQDVIGSIEDSLEKIGNSTGFEVVSGITELNDLMFLKHEASIVLERQEKESQISKLSIERDAAAAAGQDTTAIEGQIADLEASM
ncbi:MAG: hypothetical protein HRT47_08275 [Candidatus Caenarcaniphilales bacterium]|nr:hypothetical protein [Candidatus Caenarcaniphilales bacterium]